MRSQFVTDNYPTGAHVFTAVGYTTRSCKQIELQKRSAQLFVSKEEGNIRPHRSSWSCQSLAVVFGAMAICCHHCNESTCAKGKSCLRALTRSYTYGGGSCPECKRPFGFQLLGMNMIAGKLTPCPHCGKWSIVKRASMSALHAAEQAELTTEKAQISEASEEENCAKNWMIPGIKTFRARQNNR